MIKVAPSILSADFANVGQAVKQMEEYGADYIHCDVMDGTFVPNISFGFPVIKAMSKLTDKPLDVHLMIVQPEKYISAVRDCGAAIMNVHQEACLHLDRTVHAIRQAGMKAAVTLNPSTPVSTLEDIITEVDMVLLMSVNPGFGGQSYIENTYAKIARLRKLIADSGSKALIEVDGGVNLANAPKLAAAGVDVLVAGSAVFGAANPEEVIAQMAAL